MAINQGGDYLCELNQCTKELVVLYSNPQFTTQILSIINSLNEAFINFLGKYTSKFLNNLKLNLR